MIFGNFKHKNHVTLKNTKLYKAKIVRLKQSGIGKILLRDSVLRDSIYYFIRWNVITS